MSELPAERQLDEQEWRWALVGNVVESHLFGEKREIRYGTKSFSGGTKVYVAPPQWDDGFENVCVIGKPRHSFKLIEIVMKSDNIENFRLKRVFTPSVLKRMNESIHAWWGNTDEDERTIIDLVNSINRHRETAVKQLDLPKEDE